MFTRSGVLNIYCAAHIVGQAITEEGDQFAYYSKMLSQLQLELTNNVMSQILVVGKKHIDLFSICVNISQISSY